MTTNELKDAAIFVMAYSFLKMDSTQELGLFINKKASKFMSARKHENLFAFCLVGIVENFRRHNI